MVIMNLNTLMKKLLLLLITPILGYGQQFTTEEAEFVNAKDTVTLAATLTIPVDINYPPVAILISGSGQTDRDETIFQHKIFKDLAEHLSANGVAVIRYDDRGGFKSTGRNVSNSTSYELSEDAEQIFLRIKKDKRFKKSKIGFIGHSEGGMIVPMIAARNNKVDFIVSLAGTGVSGFDLLLKQNRAILLTQGIDEKYVNAYLHNVFEPAIKAISENDDVGKVKEKIVEFLIPYREKAGVNSLVPAIFSNDAFADRLIAQVGGVWGKYFIATNPKQFWTQVKCPVLALNGDKDAQVDKTQNLDAIASYLEESGNEQAKIVVMPSHNHLFQVAKTGNIMEYGQLKTGISPQTLETVTKWIKQLD